MLHEETNKKEYRETIMLNKECKYWKLCIVDSKQKIVKGELIIIEIKEERINSI